MSTRLPDPPMIPDRMVNGTGDRLSQSAPGSTPIVDPPTTGNLSDLAVNGGTPSATVAVSDESGRVRGDDGRFRTDDGGGWSMAGGNGMAGWRDC